MSDFKPRFQKPAKTSSFFDKNDSVLPDTTHFVFNRNISQSIQTQRQKLPIFNSRNYILFLLEKYQILILIGETGSGKSTQIPQVYESGLDLFNNNLRNQIHIILKTTYVLFNTYFYKMICPSSPISKLFIIILMIVLLFFVFMDFNLYMRIQNYSIDRGINDNTTINYKDVSWIGCDLNPLCDVTVKAVLLDHINYYIFIPLVTIVDDLFDISHTNYITPNLISVFHVFVAIFSAQCISSDNISYRRLGVLLFELRTFLDDMDGHVARTRKHVKGERSEIGSSGFYVDGICDALGITALLVGIFIFLKNNPPRRGYQQLPTSNDIHGNYKTKVNSNKVTKTILCFAVQLILSSLAWNRYIDLYQDMLERNDVSTNEFRLQNDIFKSSYFFIVTFLWRILNVHNLTHFILLSIFCDKLWEFLRNIQYIGFAIIIVVIFITELHYMIEAEWPGQIGICESRRVAAISLANRVADETGSLVQEDLVGYAIKFDACTKKPKIKYMTEGILLREMMSDPLLKDYSAIMLDEVHERTLYTDILMGLMKKILRKRPELRLIVASATMDAKNLFDFFNNQNQRKNDSAIIVTVKGRQFPVNIYYLLDPVPCYVQKSIDTAVKINSSKDGGDILIFLTGQEEVERASRTLKEYANNLEQNKQKNLMLVLPMYGSLPYLEQLKIFKSAPEGYRKVVVTTNVAETSITIPGIVHVIDCGFVKMRWFNSAAQTDSLITVPISKASADQRAGRAGRLKSGNVYRLYTEEYATKLAENTPPEIIRNKLITMVLQLKALGISNILKFKFPTPPPVQHLKSALEILYALGAIDINGNLTTPLGYQLSEFVVDPLYAKILLSSGNFGCSDEILTIISMLQVEIIFTKPSSGTNSIKARIQKRLFEVEEGDLITYLNVYNGFIASDMSKDFCQKNFVSYNSIKRVVEIRSRLEKLVKNFDIPIVSASSTEVICKCLVSGLFPNAAYLHYSGVYKTVRGDLELFIHPDSVFYSTRQPQWVLFCEVLNTTKLYMKDLSEIKSEWLLELAPHFYYKTTIQD